MMMKNFRKISKLGICFAAVLIMALSLAACGDGSDNETTQTKETQAAQEYTIDPQATSLTISDGEKQVVYDAEDLEEMGTETHTYSGRNKKVKNARFFEEYTGVEVNKVLENAGFETEGANIKIQCSDNYTREYSVEDDLYGKYAFTDNDSDNKTEVVPIIAIVEETDDSEYPSPFKLVYGQADWDTYTNDSQDFNVQGWGSYIQYIEVSYE